MRKFEVITKYKDENINLPRRQTTTAVGYDLEAAEDITIKPGIPTLIPTGLKAYMEEDEGLFIYGRSSGPIKQGLSPASGVGVVDSDYADNPSNEGHIFYQCINITNEDIFVSKGDRICQAVFQKILVTDGDNPLDKKREGGHGSTGKKGGNN